MWLWVSVVGCSILVVVMCGVVSVPCELCCVLCRDVLDVGCYLIVLCIVFDV